MKRKWVCEILIHAILIIISLKFGMVRYMGFAYKAVVVALVAGLVFVLWKRRDALSERFSRRGSAGSGEKLETQIKLLECALFIQFMILCYALPPLLLYGTNAGSHIGLERGDAFWILFAEAVILLDILPENWDLVWTGEAFPPKWFFRIPWISCLAQVILFWNFWGSADPWLWSLMIPVTYFAFLAEFVLNLWIRRRRIARGSTITG